MATKIPTKKLCGHAVTGECHFGNKCANYHPVNSAEARATYSAMKTKTLNLCGFHPNCTAKDCTFLHVSVQAKETDGAVAPRGRAPPTGDTPLRPAVPRPTARSRGGGAGAHRDRARGAPRADARGAAHSDEPEAFIMLNKIRGKFNALVKAEDAFRTLADKLNSPDAREKMKLAKEMQIAVTEAINSLGGSIDGYLKELGTMADDDAADESAEVAGAAANANDDDDGDDQ